MANQKNVIVTSGRKIPSISPGKISTQIGKVYGVVTTENTPTKELFDSVGRFNAIGVIFYRDYKNSKETPENLENIPLSTAFPLFPQVQNIPLIGELVYLIDLPSPVSFFNGQKNTSSGKQKYYISPINVWNNTQQNSLPADPNSSLGSTVVENPLIKSLIPYQGDYIIQSRQGSALRFSTTSRPTTTPNEWSEIGNEDDPITILTNGLKFERDKQYYVERINKDNSSLYLTSAQKIPLQTDKSGVLNNWTNPTNASDYFNSQAILNADRITLNSKKDEVMIFATTNVEINTKKVINLNADERVHLNSDSVFLGHYDPNNKPQPMLLGKETINLFQHLITSLAGLAGDLSRAVGVPEGSPMVGLNTAGNELLEDLVEAINLLEKIPSKKIFLAPDNAIQTNNATPTAPEEEVQFYQASYTPPPTPTEPPPNRERVFIPICPINFGATYNSGNAEIDSGKIELIDAKVKELVACINQQKSQVQNISEDIYISIEGGESQVPNPDMPGTTTPYPRKALGKERSENLKKYLLNVLPEFLSAFIPKIEILPTKVGETKWIGDPSSPNFRAANDPLFTAEQYVKATVYVRKEVEPFNCDYKDEARGGIAKKENNYLFKEGTIPLSGVKNGTQIEITFNPVSIPDYLLIRTDKGIIQSGFIGLGSINGVETKATSIEYYETLAATVLGNSFGYKIPQNSPFPKNLYPLNTNPLESFNGRTQILQKEDYDKATNLFKGVPEEFIRTSFKELVNFKGTRPNSIDFWPAAEQLQYWKFPNKKFIDTNYKTEEGKTFIITKTPDITFLQYQVYALLPDTIWRFSIKCIEPSGKKT